MAICKLENPTKPFFPYFGGKSRVAKKLACSIPKHSTYVESFAGGASVYFAKNSAKKNVLNDLDSDTVKLLKAGKNRPSAITSCKIKDSKWAFQRARNKSNRNACDILHIKKLSFGSNGSFAKKNKKFNNNLNNIQRDKLKKATILSQDFRAVMKRYDKKETLHFLDPPYVEQGYRYKHHRVTPEEVCGTAKKMKGKVMITYDKNSKVRNACKGLKFKSISRVWFQLHIYTAVSIKESSKICSF